jgi:hypothetical protein
VSSCASGATASAAFPTLAATPSNAVACTPLFTFTSVGITGKDNGIMPSISVDSGSVVSSSSESFNAGRAGACMAVEAGVGAAAPASWPSMDMKSIAMLAGAADEAVDDDATPGCEVLATVMGIPAAGTLGMMILN